MGASTHAKEVSHMLCVHHAAALGGLQYLWEEFSPVWIGWLGASRGTQPLSETSTSVKLLLL